MKRSDLVKLISDYLEDRLRGDFDPWGEADHILKVYIEKCMVPNYMPGWDEDETPLRIVGKKSRLQTTNEWKERK